MGWKGLNRPSFIDNFTYIYLVLTERGVGPRIFHLLLQEQKKKKKKISEPGTQQNKYQPK